MNSEKFSLTVLAFITGCLDELLCFLLCLQGYHDPFYETYFFTVILKGFEGAAEDAALFPCETMFEPVDVNLPARVG